MPDILMVCQNSVIVCIFIASCACYVKGHRCLCLWCNCSFADWKRISLWTLEIKEADLQS